MTWYRLLGLLAAVIVAAVAGRLAARNGLRLSADGPPVCEMDAEHDFGAVEFGQVVPLRLTVANAGGTSLQVGRPRKSCNCLSVAVANPDGGSGELQELSVAPGDRTELVVSVRCTGETGQQRSETLYFPTNLPDRPELPVTFRFRVSRRFYTLPSGLDGGSVPVGRVWRAEATVFGPADWPAHLPPQVTCSNPDVRVEFSPAASRAADGRPEAAHGQLTVSLAAVPAGDVTAAVSLVFGGRGEPSVLTVPVRLRGVDAIEITPADIYLPLRTSAGPAYQSRVLIRSTDGAAFTVRFEPPAGVRVVCSTATEPTAVKVVEVYADPKPAPTVATVGVVCQTGERVPAHRLTAHIAPEGPTCEPTSDAGSR